jgi:hypothetical protein
MRWFIAAVALTVICAMFGSAAALVLGGAALKLPGTDRPVLSLKTKGSGFPLPIRGRELLRPRAPTG